MEGFLTGAAILLATSEFLVVSGSTCTKLITRMVKFQAHSRTALLRVRRYLRSRVFQKQGRGRHSPNRDDCELQLHRAQLHDCGQGQW